MFSPTQASGGGVVFRKGGYRPEVDGLRTVAVLPVVFYHFKLGFPAGYTGVDVFFVISGYLITGVLIHDLNCNCSPPDMKHLLKDFWERRVRRLFPALACMLIGTLVAANSIYLADLYQVSLLIPAQVPQPFVSFTANSLFFNHQDLGKQITSVLLMSANYHYKDSLTSYFSADETEIPFLHCWSLAVEEQFYVFYPIVIGLFWRVPSLRQPWMLALLLVLLTLVSLTASVHLAKSNPTYAFYLLPCRAWEMALGGLLCFDFNLPRSASNPLSESTMNFERREWYAWFGLFMIVSSMFVFTAETPYPSYNALLPTGGTMLFIMSQRKSLTSAGRFLSLPSIIYVGKISYPLYLWHWPIYVLMSYSTPGGELSLSNTIGGVILSLVMASWSYTFIEPIFRKRKTPKVDRLKIDKGAFEKEKNYDGLNRAELEMVRLVDADSNNLNEGVKNQVFTSSPPPTPHKKGPSLFILLVVWMAIFFFSNLISNYRIGGIYFGNYSELSDGGQVFDGNNKDSCMKFYSTEEIDEMFDVAVEDISVENILASPGYDGTYGYPPFPIGPPDEDGVHRPKIAYVGSSHCLMHGPVLDQLHKEYQVAGVFLCHNGIPGYFGAGIKDEGHDSEKFDERRREVFDSYGRKLDQIVWLDYWSHTNWFKEDHDWGADFDAFLNYAQKVTILGDSPLLPIMGIGDDVLKNFVYQKYKVDGDFTFLKVMEENLKNRESRTGNEGRIAEAVKKSEYKDKVTFTEIASYFEDGRNDDHLQLVNPFSGMLVYKDYGHLNVEGNKLLKQLYRKEIFGQEFCTQGEE